MDPLITIILAVCNNASTLELTFESLLKQKNNELIKEFIIIDDSSIDSSVEVINRYMSKFPFKVTFVHKAKDLGLTGTYNMGIKLCTSKYFILMHADMQLISDDAFIKMIEPLHTPKTKVIATTPTSLNPYSVWKNYGFWQKSLSSRFVDKKARGLNGKFDCFNKEVLINKVGLFDQETFVMGGEDLDMYRRIYKAGYIVQNTDAQIIHVHNTDPKFSLSRWAKKETQIAEAQGAFLRKHGIYDLKLFFETYFRIILLFGLFIPYVRYVSFVLIILFSFFYTTLVYQKEFKNPRILLLPFINIYMLILGSVYTIRGYINGKEIIR